MKESTGNFDRINKLLSFYGIVIKLWLDFKVSLIMLVIQTEMLPDKMCYLEFVSK